MTNVWAYSKNVPEKTCPDARLLGGGTNLQFPAGDDHGQAGWDIGLMFNTIGDLSEKLRVVMESRTDGITRLAINVHGSPGAIDADSTSKMYNFTQLWNRYSSQLVFINHMLVAGAPVLIMGCQVAAGDDGAAFLSDMSQHAFPGHKVVGFTTIGESLRQYRRGEYCTEAGMRDTPYDTPSEGKPLIKAQREKEVLTLPWASETSPHAKVALAGKIIAGAEQPVAPVDTSFESYLPGTWSVTIGSWNGYFVFKRDRTVFWTDDSQRPHKGQWGTMAGSIDWSFSDDPPGWIRNFEVLTPLKSNLNGTITINDNPHGFFTMSKQL